MGRLITIPEKTNFEKNSNKFSFSLFSFSHLFYSFQRHAKFPKDAEKNLKIKTINNLEIKN